jgi:hypothetical protein
MTLDLPRVPSARSLATALEAVRDEAASELRHCRLDEARFWFAAAHFAEDFAGNVAALARVNDPALRLFVLALLDSTCDMEQARLDLIERWLDVGKHDVDQRIEDVRAQITDEFERSRRVAEFGRAAVSALAGS